MSRICFITAIYGNYEKSCKKFVKQSIDTDFICFTDNINIFNNGWIIDTNPYHLINKSNIDDDSFINSITNNKHTFNIAKYYKQQFKNIPVLQKYDVIIWLDGTIEIIYDKTSEFILNNIYTYKIIGWYHEYHNGDLANEVNASHMVRYTSTRWNNQNQPYQDIDNQFKHYLEDGMNPKCTIYITCFVAFLFKDKTISDFLDLWYLQTLKYTTQDQISFPFVCYKTNITPLTLPNTEIYGDKPHSNTLLYIKHNHGY